MARISITVNGTAAEPHDVPDQLPMVDYLHDYLGLTGTKFGCGIGVCHACVVIVDNPDGTSETRRTCISAASTFDGLSVRTVEGHAPDGALSPVQLAFVEHFAFQCGYCTPGFVNAATVLVERLAREPVARDAVEKAVQDGIGDHVCRCTGYVRYHQALRDYILSQPNLVQG
jgi:xanthine dehydrogenase YagT iron-sulfur-binding subunit